MQSGGGVQGGHGRNMVAGPPSSSASPSSSSSAVSTPQLGFDPMQQQQQQQRQTLQQQLLRNPEAREAMLAYQSGNLQGVLGTNVAQMQGQNRNQGFDQNMMNPVHQAYNQYAFQNQQKSGLGMQPQQQIRMGTVVPSSKDQKMQDSDQGQSQSQNQKQFVTPTSLGQLVQGGSNSVRPMSAPQAPQNMTMAAQLQAMQALALERNIDLSLPQNANLVAQLIPLMQARMQKANETSMTNDNSPRGNSSSDLGSAKTRQNIPPGHLGSTSNPLLVNNPGPGQVGQSQVQGPDHGQQLPPRQPAPVNSMNQGFMQQTNRSSSQLKLPSNFTKQQLHVLKAQILAFRRIKKGEKTLPNELIQAIAPPPLEAQTQPSTANAGAINVKSQSQPDDQTRRLESNDKELQAAAFTSGTNNTKREGHEENAATVMSTQKETPPVLPAKQEQEVELGVQKTSNVIDRPIDKGKSVISEPVTVPDNVQSKRPLQAGNPPQTKDSGPKKYHGPLFDFPFFTRKHDAFGSSMMINNNNNLPLAYDLKDLIAEEGTEVINKKRNESIEKINSLLAVNLERRRIRPDVVLRLQIEEKKLKLQDLQKRVRDGVDQNQQDIMAMPIGRIGSSFGYVNGKGWILTGKYKLPNARFGINN
ncbi:putative transcription factor interactor and regulator C3H-WRC/GRF family [Helianthus annuus]|nr:putative transcription factor interactor and regulator C3H-WRC/GRF family [Helianthus annuus]